MIANDVATPIAIAPSGQQSRLIARFVAEIQIAAMVSMSKAIEQISGGPASVDRAMVTAVVLRACPNYQCEPNDPSILTINEGHPISINAIAASLARPFETVRRHITALTAADICERTPTGIAMAPSAMASPPFRQMVRTVHDLLVRLICYVKEHEVVLPVQPVRVGYMPGATVTAALDLLLSAVEYMDPHYQDWLEMVVVNAVMAANARPITFDRTLALRYAAVDDIPPESLRQPVKVTDLARALDIPYSTVQRQINASIKRDQLARVPGGIMVTQQQLNAAAVRIGGPTAVMRATRAFSRLVPGGFRFDDPASCYRDGPPPLVDFGKGTC